MPDFPLHLLLLFLPFLRAQKVGNNEPLVVPTKGPLATFPALITADNFPLFPFTDQYSTGIEVNPANKVVRLFLLYRAFLLYHIRFSRPFPAI